MTRNTKTIKSPDGNKLAIVNPDAAGIDIADTDMQVCVPEGRDGDNNRRFGSFTCELNSRPLKSIFQRNIPSGDAFAEICFLRGDYLMYLNDSFHSSQNQESGFAHHAKGQSHQCRRKHRCFTQTTAIICTKKQYQDVLRVSDESRQLFYSSFTNIPHGFSSFEKEENSCGI